MKIPVILQKIAQQHGLTVVPITYRIMGYKDRGYDLIDKYRNIQLKLQPVWYTNKDRWLVINHAGYRPEYVSKMHYLQRLTQLKHYLARENFKPIGHTGYVLAP